MDPANTSLVGKMWATAYQYDPQGRLLVETDPSGVTTSGGQAFLADSISGAPAGNWYLNTSGLEHVTDYYSSGTASAATRTTRISGRDTAARAIYNRRKPIQIQLGTGGRTIIPLATDTVYRNTGGIGSETTTFTYAFPTNSIQATSETTIHPIITATENGPGGTNADTETDTLPFISSALQHPS